MSFLGAGGILRGLPPRQKFAPKILLCAQLMVLSIRNANIVF